MSSDYSNQNSRGKYSRGRDRRPRQRNGKSSHYSSRSKENNSSSSRTTSAKKKKISLWKRILHFFGIGSSGHGHAFKGHATKDAQEHASSHKRTGQTKTTRSYPTIRKPEAIEVNSPRVYVGNLSFDATEGDLFELFNGIGLVHNVEIVSNRYTHRSKGFGFVQMQSIEEARRAVTELHDKEYMGRKLVVSGAKMLDARPAALAESTLPSDSQLAEQ